MYMSSKNNLKVAIIDPVGVKAGMNYYDISLMRNMANKDVCTYIYSNYTNIDNKEATKYYQFFKPKLKSSSLIKFFHYIKAFYKSAKHCKNGNIDFVIAHVFSTNLISFIGLRMLKFFKLKTLIIMHDITSLNNDDSRIFRNYICNKLSDIIVVHNKFSYETIIEKSKINDLDKIHLIKHGGYGDFTNNDISKESARKALGLEQNKKYVLFFGQIKELKGLDILLNAMSKINKDINLIIAGKTWKSKFTYYNSIIEKDKLENRIIKKIEYIDDKTRDLLFNAADISVIPYKLVYQSGVMLMSMTYGLPVIASNLPANKEIIIDKENGILFKSEDVFDLSEKISSLIQDNEMIEKIRKNSINTISREYSWIDISNKYYEILNK